MLNFMVDPKCLWPGDILSNVPLHLDVLSDIDSSADNGDDEVTDTDNDLQGSTLWLLTFYMILILSILYYYESVVAM